MISYSYTFICFHFIKVIILEDLDHSDGRKQRIWKNFQVVHLFRRCPLSYRI